MLWNSLLKRGDQCPLIQRLYCFNGINKWLRIDVRIDDYIVVAHKWSPIIEAFDLILTGECWLRVYCVGPALGYWFGFNWACKFVGKKKKKKSDIKELYGVDFVDSNILWCFLFYFIFLWSFVIFIYLFVVNEILYIFFIL